MSRSRSWPTGSRCPTRLCSRWAAWASRWLPGEFELTLDPELALALFVAPVLLAADRTPRALGHRDHGLVTGHQVLAQLGALALASLHVLLAAVVFMRVYRLAMRTGLLARYSAEGIG